MANADFPSVAAYIAAQPPAVRKLLRQVQGAIRKALPGAEESISYQIPAYKVEGRAVLYFAGWSNHYSLYPITDGVAAAFAKELAPYEVQRGTVRFPLDKPVPIKLIAGIAKLRAKEASVSVKRSQARRR
jgi:uncharacterized protein YdhG (YjbR/CyaY superfamily)